MSPLVIVMGKVVHGSGDGKKLGFPTLNIKISDELADFIYGVYAGYVYINDTKYTTAVHYGPRRVFNEDTALLEAHVLEFNEEVYNHIIRLELIEFIRPTLDFSSTEELVEQMHKDVQLVKEVLKNLGDV
ncbi:riboflavin kinase [Candidatus Dojkabacteria bacterium]|uniref:riboflavin kinase n=1 Tax=Candidatus Dojkabacteria bacterium TaxID=2099670 RepID=A0A955L9W3_9BACT|nr:riboflavin kinase [Candidatus Dojkabacteria bacterium]